MTTVTKSPRLILLAALAFVGLLGFTLPAPAQCVPTDPNEEPFARSKIEAADMNGIASLNARDAADARADELALAKIDCDTMFNLVIFNIPAEWYPTIVAQRVQAGTYAAEGDTFRTNAHLRRLEGNEILVSAKLAYSGWDGQVSPDYCRAQSQADLAKVTYDWAIAGYNNAETSFQAGCDQYNTCIAILATFLF